MRGNFPKGLISGWLEGFLSSLLEAAMVEAGKRTARSNDDTKVIPAGC